jgi:N-acetylglucosamine-6-phosphate deacetylase
LKVKGPARLALVTDCSRALDCPDGPYLFGPLDGGEPFQKRDGVGLMPDGKSLASSVVGMDDCVRTFQKLTDAHLFEAVRMASLTPAQIAGWGDRIGSLAPGKFADFVVMDKELNIRDVYIGGRLLAAPSPPGTPGGEGRRD